MLLPIHHHAGFVRANNTIVQNTLPDQFIGINTFGCQPVKQVMQTTLADVRPQKVVQQLLKPFKRKILPDIEVSYQGLNVPAVADRAIYPNRKRAFNNLSKCTLTHINPVFGYNLFDYRNMDHLTFTKKFNSLFVCSNFYRIQGKNTRDVR